MCFRKSNLYFSGLIGRSWAMLFAAAGHEVVLFDILPKQIEDALAEILIQLKDLQSKGLLRGTLSVEQQHSKISGTTDLKQCISDSIYVQVAIFLIIMHF